MGVRIYGLRSTTVVDGVYSINEREDFDLLRAETGPPGWWFEPWRDMLLFSRVLRDFDVIVTFLDGGFLRWTALRRIEPWLLRRAGIVTIVTHYGSDNAVIGYLDVHELNDAMEIDYPDTVKAADAIRRRVDRIVAGASVVVRNLNTGYLPRWDVIWPAQYAVDVREFSRAAPSASDGQSGPVTVVHAPNHRAIKGTAHLVAAIETLRAEGLDVRLEIIEGEPNAEVRRALTRADILVDQLLIGYGLFAVEGMATGLPVISRMGWMPEPVASHPSMLESPIVDADQSTISDRLRELVTDPERRLRLGIEGLSYVRRWHSEEATGKVWDAIIRATWNERPVPTSAFPFSSGVEVAS